MKVMNEIIDELKISSICKSSELNKSARENQWSLFISKTEYDDLTMEKLVDFLEGAYFALKEKWHEGFVFYSWFDAMAGQLRFSSVSARHKKLPFNRKLIIIDDAEVLAVEALNEYSDMYKGTNLCKSTRRDPLLILVWR